MTQAPLPSQVHQSWPDQLQPSTAAIVETHLTEFWQLFACLPDLLHRQEHLLAEHLTTRLRGVIIELMLALNGIQWPAGTQHLNSYLSASQRTALEKTLSAPSVSGESWIGRAVALVVIYRWYAPQLVAKFALSYPQQLEAEVWALLQRDIPDWPLTVTTE